MLEQSFQKFGTEEKELFDERMSACITPAHIASFLLNPKYITSTIVLSAAEQESGTDFIEENFSIEFMRKTYIKFRSQTSPFRPAFFVDVESPYEWWNAINKINSSSARLINQNDLSILDKLLTAVASSAGIERTFSKFGLIHTKLRNKLGVERAGKLVFVNQQLNEKN